jgi:hypothetical protein
MVRGPQTSWMRRSGDHEEPLAPPGTRALAAPHTDRFVTRARLTHIVQAAGISGVSRNSSHEAGLTRRVDGPYNPRD